MQAIGSAAMAVGVDDGYRKTKIAYRDSAGKIATFMVDSSAKNGEHFVDVYEQGAAGLYRVDNQTVTVADGMDGDSIRYDAYHTSVTNRAVLQHALRQVPAIRDRDLLVTAGLPAASFYSANKVNQFLIEQKTENMLGSVVVLSGDKRAVKLKWAQLISQAVAAYIDFRVDDDGNPRTDSARFESLGIVDIGGSTTDALVIQGGQVLMDSVVTHNVGTLDLYAALSDFIRSETRIQPPRRKISEALMTGKISMLGNELDCTDAIKTAIAHHTPSILDACDRAFDKGARVDGILMVGGGAQYFAEAINERYRVAHLAADPVFANARGMLKQAESSIKALIAAAQ